MSGPALGRTVQDGEVIQAVGIGTVHPVNVTGTADRIGPFDSLTTVVRIKARTGICVRTGDDTVTATTSDTEYDAGDVEYIKVDPGGYLSYVKQSGAADGTAKFTETT